MKLDSKYFDHIRVSSRRAKPQQGRTQTCDWPGCRVAGGHMAPKGRGRDGEFFSYCINHVREYNKTYNYFSGMSDAEVRDFQKASMTGHRPTWASGVNSWSEERARDAKRATGYQHGFESSDPYGFFNEATGSAQPKPPRKPIRNAERKCLSTLNLDETASAQDIKNSYKSLVKLHHPDRHGGDRSSEDKLREVLDAYHYLKQAGLC
ncbi:MAG: DnaJ domain-containing protein [Chitinophagales bacterium]|nr:DnaJ domain-containing protein [Hyphomicrobiales bacterium]